MIWFIVYLIIGKWQMFGTAFELLFVVAVAVKAAQ